MTPKALSATDTASVSTSYGLLVLRLAGLSLFLKHGWEKLSGYSTMVQHFPDPIHVGAHAGLAFALLSDGICSVLVLIGLATRPAAVVILINLLAWRFPSFITQPIFPTLTWSSSCSSSSLRPSCSRVPGDSASTRAWKRSSQGISHHVHQESSRNWPAVGIGPLLCDCRNAGG
jgi:hypothetical protein